MSLDVELILAALDKHFDAVEARWDRLFAAQDARGYQLVSSRESAFSAQASTGVPDLTQFATVGDENTAVGGGLRGGGDGPSEHHLKAPIVADNWGGLFEQPAHMLEEHELTSTDEVRNSTDEIHTGSCLTSTNLDMPVYIAPAHACVAPVPASCLTSTDKDDITTSTPTRCSTAGLIRGELVLAAVTAVPVPSSTSSCALGVAPAEMSASATVSTPSLLATTIVSTFSLAPAILGAKEEVPDEWPIKCSPDYLSTVLEMLHPCSFKWSQFRYRTSYIPEIHGTQQSFKLLSAHNSLPIQPLHASLVHKGPGLFILHSRQLSIQPKPPWSLACSEYNNFNCNCVTLVIWMVWLQFLVHTANVQLRPLPWPSFSVRPAVQLEKALSYFSCLKARRQSAILMWSTRWTCSANVRVDGAKFFRYKCELTGPKVPGQRNGIQYWPFIVQQLTSIIAVQDLFLWDPGGDPCLPSEFESINSLSDHQMQQADLSFIKKRGWLVLLQFLSSVGWPSQMDSDNFLLGYFPREGHCVFRLYPIQSPDDFSYITTLDTISLALHCNTNSSSITDGQQRWFSIGQIQNKSSLLILSSYSVFLQWWSILLDANCSLNIGYHQTKMQVTGLFYTMLIAEFKFKVKELLPGVSYGVIKINNVALLGYLTRAEHGVFRLYRVQPSHDFLHISTLAVLISTSATKLLGGQHQVYGAAMVGAAMVPARCSVQSVVTIPGDFQDPFFSNDLMARAAAHKYIIKMKLGGFSLDDQLLRYDNYMATLIQC